MSILVEISNFALNHLGINKFITSMDDNSTEAENCKVVYPFALEDILRAGNWNVATKTKALALCTNETVPGYEYVYMYPEDCLRVLKLVDSDGQSPNNKGYDYIERKSSSDSITKVIATNLEQAYMEYTWNVTDVSIFDSVFTVALSYRMASLMAMSLTGNANLGLTLNKFYENKISEAKKYNLIESNNTQKINSKYVQVRS